MSCPRTIRILALTVVLWGPIQPSAGSGEQILRDQCAACHAIEPPADTDPVARLEASAPPLYYAGNKYREPWLVEWLQTPTTITPAGYVPVHNIAPGPDGDVIDADRLPVHPALDAEDARDVAAALMGLRPHDRLLEQEDYEPGTVALRMGTMDFRRFKGCIACHQDRPGTGGVSGPELHSAWARLQPGYLVSYIRDPQAWDPLATMPDPELTESAVHRLVDYLHTLSEE